MIKVFIACMNGSNYSNAGVNRICLSKGVFQKENVKK